MKQMTKTEKRLNKVLAYEYVLDLNTGRLYRRTEDVNQRWKAHRDNNKISTFYACMDFYGKLDNNRNFTPKQIAKNINRLHVKTRYKLYEDYDLAMLASARMLIGLNPKMPLRAYKAKVDEIVERVGKDFPEKVI